MAQEGRKRAIRKATTSNKNKRQKVENMDKISQMPNEILLMIMCLLPVDDVVRTCVLSKRWQNLWKQVPRLTLDVKHMIKPLKQLKISSPAKQLNYILNLPQEQGIYRYSILVYLILHHHEGDLKSLRFTHFPLRQLQTTLDFLFDRKKTIEALTLECRPLYTKKEKMRTQLFMGMYCSGLFAPLVSLQLVNYHITSHYPFKGCNKMRAVRLSMVEIEDDTLSGMVNKCPMLERLSVVGCSKLKFVEILHARIRFLELRALCVEDIVVSCNSLDTFIMASIACNSKRILVNARRLRVFQSQCNPINSKVTLAPRAKPVIKTHEIFESLGDDIGIPKANIFRFNLTTLMIDLDLNFKRAVQALTFILGSCVNLHTLDIAAPIYQGSRKMNPDDNGGMEYWLLWEEGVVSHCIDQKLKNVSIMGFKGKELETEFVKYIITRGRKMEKMTIVCKKSRKEAACLVPMQDQKASQNLSIMVGPNKKSPLFRLNQLFKNKKQN